MKTASIRLILQKNGSDISLNDVTPAECVLLRSIHQPKLGRDPVTSVKPGPDVARDTKAEKARLLLKYKEKLVEKCFPGDTPNMPDNFGGVAVAAPTPTLQANQPTGAIANPAK